jgi:hypothetical protein
VVDFWLVKAVGRERIFTPPVGQDDRFAGLVFWASFVKDCPRRRFLPLQAREQVGSGAGLGRNRRNFYVSLVCMLSTYVRNARRLQSQFQKQSIRELSPSSAPIRP